jgi:hypothetical protein
MDSPNVLGIAGEEVKYFIFSAGRKGKAIVIHRKEHMFSLHTNHTRKS